MGRRSAPRGGASYSGSFEPLPDLATSDRAGVGEAPCGVCGDEEAPWRHQAASLASADGRVPAGWWQLCDVCHDVLLAGDDGALLDRASVTDADDARLVVDALMAAARASGGA